LVASAWRLCRVRQAYCSYHLGRSAFVTVAGETVEATYGHPFWVVRGEQLAERPRRADMAPVTAGATTPGRWVDAGDLRVGDEMLLRDGEVGRVEALRYGFLDTAVYNFDIEGLHSYAVGRSEVLVHNGNASPIGAGGSEPTTPNSSDPTQNGPMSPAFPNPPEPPPADGWTWNPWGGFWDPPPGRDMFPVRPPGW
jgi:hypothetical protein